MPAPETFPTEALCDALRRRLYERANLRLSFASVPPSLLEEAIRRLAGALARHATLPEARSA